MNTGFPRVDLGGGGVLSLKFIFPSCFIVTEIILIL